MPTIRRKNTTIAVAIETTRGVDQIALQGGAMAALDFVKADVTLTYDQATIANPELTGTLDASPSIPGGTKVRLTLTTMLKGSGTPGVSPQFGKLLEIAGWAKSTVAAIPAAAITAGTVKTATLGAGFTDTPQLYRGMLARLSGNPAGGLLTTLADYATGKVATISHTLPTALDTTTQVAIPAQTLYTPTSDPAATKSATIYVFMDGIIWPLIGCASTWKLDVKTGGVGTLTNTITGMYVPAFAGPTPSGLVFDAVQPPVFRGGMSRLGGFLARVATASFDSGATLYEPENPEATEGFDASIITGRAAKATFDPSMDTVATINRIAAFKSGGPTTAAISYGTSPGNLLGITIPRAQYTGYAQANRSDTMADTMSIECNAPDAPILVAVG